MGHADLARERDALHRFFVTADSVGADQVRFTATQKKQMRAVLRLKAGDRVLALPGDGCELLVTLRDSADGMIGEVIGRDRGIAEPTRRVWLYQSALRGDRFAWLLQKATELGAAGIVPVIFRYTQPADYAARSDRYETIMREAAEQCRRTALPVLSAVMSFRAAAAHARADEGAVHLILDEQDRSMPMRRALASRESIAVRVFIGPEGGLSTDERAEAAGLGLQSVTVGPRILRSETAGLAALTIALAGSGDLD